MSLFSRKELIAGTIIGVVGNTAYSILGILWEGLRWDTLGVWLRSRVYIERWFVVTMIFILAFLTALLITRLRQYRAEKKKFEDARDERLETTIEKAIEEVSSETMLNDAFYGYERSPNIQRARASMTQTERGTIDGLLDEGRRLAGRYDEQSMGNLGAHASATARELDRVGERLRAAIRDALHRVRDQMNEGP